MSNSERGRTVFTRMVICAHSCRGTNVTKQKLSDKMHYDRCANVSVYIPQQDAITRKKRTNTT